MTYLLPGKWADWPNYLRPTVQEPTRPCLAQQLEKTSLILSFMESLSQAGSTHFPPASSQQMWVDLGVMAPLERQ